MLHVTGYYGEKGPVSSVGRDLTLLVVDRAPGTSVVMGEGVSLVG